MPSDTVAVLDEHGHDDLDCRVLAACGSDESEHERDSQLPPLADQSSHHDVIVAAGPSVKLTKIKWTGVRYCFANDRFAFDLPHPASPPPKHA